MTELITFDQYVERALYDPETGFYATTGRAGGRHGDFITSVEVGPLFSAIVADWLDTTWRALGQPAPYRVSEAAAGRGTLWRGIQRAKPACIEALEYTLVERSAALRAGYEPEWVAMPDLPDQPQHVIVANELLDNLPFGIAERTRTGWAPVEVQLSAGEAALRVGSDSGALAYLASLAVDAAVGSRVPVAGRAASWVQRAQELAERVLVFDYGASTAELAARGQQGWLRTYAGHQRGSDPLRSMGRYDITYDVPVDQLPKPSSTMLQGDWLRLNGIDARVSAARAVWAERAHIGDLEAMIARSAVNESAALVDPAGLGGFLVLEWRRP